MLSLLLPAVSFLKAEDVTTSVPVSNNNHNQVPKVPIKTRLAIPTGPETTVKGRGEKITATGTLTRILENRGVRIDLKIDRASTTEKRLENRQNNIERIMAKIASSTASTTASTTKKLDKLNDRLQKQQDQMAKVKDRLVNKELKITDVLGQIASKIQARITILEGNGLDLTAAKAKLADASVSIETMTVEENNLATLVNTEITDANQTQLFTDIKTEQDKIRTLARTTQALLVDTVKEIAKVLPAKSHATSTATSTE